MQGIANRLKQALHLDAKTGGGPIAEENVASVNAAPTANASPVGPGTDQTSTGVRSGATSATSMGRGSMQSGSAASGTTGDLHKEGGVGEPTGRTGELRTGGVTGGTIPATTIASTGIPTGSEMPLPVRNSLLVIYLSLYIMPAPYSIIRASQSLVGQPHAQHHMQHGDTRASLACIAAQCIISVAAGSQHADLIGGSLAEGGGGDTGGPPPGDICLHTIAVLFHMSNYLNAATTPWYVCSSSVPAEQCLVMDSALCKD